MLATFVLIAEIELNVGKSSLQFFLLGFIPCDVAVVPKADGQFRKCVQEFGEVIQIVEFKV